MEIVEAIPHDPLHHSEDKEEMGDRLVYPTINTSSSSSGSSSSSLLLQAMPLAPRLKPSSNSNSSRQCTTLIYMLVRLHPDSSPSQVVLLGVS